jgi:large subunit ribosomal protein L3
MWAPPALLQEMCLSAHRARRGGGDLGPAQDERSARVKPGGALACARGARVRGRDVATKAIVGEKVGMTQVWDDQNRAIPVTVLRVAPVRVVQVKTPEKEGYSAVQVTWGFRRSSTLTKPELGHYQAAGVEPGRRLVELRLEDTADLAVGQELTAELLSAGERVDAIAVSKGKGFAGGMKRHNFKGQGAAHGNHKHHRAPGSIGACATPSRVFKGTRMAGRMGGRQVTALNLEIISSDPERELVLVKGAVPGPRGAVVLLRDSVKAVPQRNGSRS